MVSSIKHKARRGESSRECRVEAIISRIERAAKTEKNGGRLELEYTHTRVLYAVYSRVTRCTKGRGRRIRDKFRGIYYLDKRREFAWSENKWSRNSALFIGRRLVRLDACKPCRQNVDQRSIRSRCVSLERIVSAFRSFPLRELFATGCV